MLTNIKAIRHPTIDPTEQRKKMIKRLLESTFSLSHSLHNLDIWIPNGAMNIRMRSDEKVIKRFSSPNSFASKKPTSNL